MLSAAGCVTRKTRKGRAVAARPLTELLNDSAVTNNTTAARLQRLNALAGVTGRRAELIAFLIWGEMCDDR